MNVQLIQTLKVLNCHMFFSIHVVGYCLIKVGYLRPRNTVDIGTAVMRQQ